MRGTFGNIRLRNQLVPGKEGPYTVHLPGRRGAVHLRRRDALQAGRHAARPGGRQGVRLGIVARLGGQGHDAAWRPRGHGRVLRAHPSVEPRRHGRPAPPVQAGRQRGLARADRPRDVHRDRPRRRACRRASRSRSRPSATSLPAATARSCASRRSPAWTARSRSTTTARAASCPPSCGASRARTSPAADSPSVADRLRRHRRPGPSRTRAPQPVPAQGGVPSTGASAPQGA